MKLRTALLASFTALLSISGVVAASDQPTLMGAEMSDRSTALQQQDLIPPNTSLTIGAPQSTHDGILWVSAGTEHTLTATDNLDPPNQLKTELRFYRVAAVQTPAFGPYTGPFNLQGADGRYRIEFRSTDQAGNAEAVKSQTEHLDTTLPLASWSISEPIFFDDFGQPWTTAETLHRLEAHDPDASDGSPGSGIREIRYRISGGPAAPSGSFVVYEAPFNITGPDGEYEIDFFATDRVENQGQTQTVQAFLDNTPPAIDLGGPYAGDEGAEFTFDASETVDAGSGLAQIVWDLDEDGNFDDAVGPVVTRTYSDNGQSHIATKVTDNLGNSDIAMTPVEVRNVSPTVSIASISTTQPYPGRVVTLEGAFTDPGWLDTHTAVVDWGDGASTNVAVSEENEAPDATGTFTAQHAYTTMGTFNITVTVIDDDGDAGTASARAEVNLLVQMPGTIIATDELMFYRLTGTTPGTGDSAQWQWRYGQGNARYWWIGKGQDDYLFLLLKTPNDAPSYNPQRPTEPWENFLTIAVLQEDFQRWFWCGIALYDEYNRFIGIGCDPQWSPPPDGAGLLHPWVENRIVESESHIANVVHATFQTAPEPQPQAGVWISPLEVIRLPMSGSAWDNLKTVADQDAGMPDLSNQDDDTNVAIMAKALVYARTGKQRYRDDVVAALRVITFENTEAGGRTLALGRELAAYVIAADLIGLAQYDPVLDAAFGSKLRELLNKTLDGRTLQSTHEDRPNNWGTHAGASRAAVAVYLGDAAELARTAQVFKGYLGDRSAYAGFNYGSDLSWQCDPDQPVGVNPTGCVKEGHSIDGVLPDDQRRDGGFRWPPPKVNYVWEGLQGAVVLAEILHRAGYPAWEWEDRALLRAVTWLHEQADYPAEGDDEWQSWIVNYRYGTDFPAATPARHGKNMGWTDWTHSQ